MHWNLIHKLLSDQCSEAERAKVERWLEEDTEHRVFLNTMQRIWEVDPKKEGEVNIKAAWNKFRKRKMASPNPQNMSNSVRKQRGYHTTANNMWYQRKGFYGAAAVILLLTTVFFVANNHLIFSENITYQEIITKKGEKTSVKLSDGTHVMLNAESSVKIPSNYDEVNRTLYLEGEAFFEVKHDEAKPFRVYSGNVLTEDLGTKFNINTYSGDDRVEVVVAEGKVAMSNYKKLNKDTVQLVANDFAVASESGTIEIKKISNLASYIGWTQRKLVFDNTPFGEVTKALERWYGVKIIVEDKDILDHKLTAIFENEALSNVLKLIRRTMDIETTSRQGTITISKKVKSQTNS